MHWDGSINVGTIVTGLVMFVGFYHAHRQNIVRLERIEERLGLIFSWWKKHAIKGMDEE